MDLLNFILTLLAGAILGGGAVIALGFKRVLDVPKDIRLHNERVRNADQDLDSWITDTDKKLGIELQRTHNEMAAKGQLYSGARVRELDHVRDQVMEACRNRHREVERLRREIALTERWSHKLLRKITGNPLPRITAHKHHADILASWEEPPARRFDPAA
jgi:hypothetical protein